MRVVAFLARPRRESREFFRAFILPLAFISRFRLLVRVIGDLFKDRCDSGDGSAQGSQYHIYNVRSDLVQTFHPASQFRLVGFLSFGGLRFDLLNGVHDFFFFYVWVGWPRLDMLIKLFEQGGPLYGAEMSAQEMRERLKTMP